MEETSQAIDQPEAVAELPVRPLSDAAREVALEELKFHHERHTAGSDVVTTIGQNIFFLVAAGAVAATQVPEAVVIVPLVWSAWLFHSLQRSRDTIKHHVFARALEARINISVGQSGEGLLLWSRVLTTMKPPIITAVNFAYWGLLNLLSWVIATVILFKEGHEGFAITLILAGVLIYGDCSGSGLRVVAG